MRFLRLLSTAVIVALGLILPDSAAFGATKKYINSVSGGDRLAGVVRDQPFCDGIEWLISQR